jgi:hypothetical protein
MFAGHERASLTLPWSALAQHWITTSGFGLARGIRKAFSDIA